MNHQTPAPTTTLNAPFAEPSSQPAPHVRTIAVTSGKGGVGKTNFVVNVALELAALGRTVTLLDADMALANANVLFGVSPTYHIGHVLSGQRTLEEVVVEVSPNVRLIPGSNGVEEMANLSHHQHRKFIAEMEAMENESDYMFIDTASGIANNVTGVLCAASEVVVVTTPEPTAIIDSYAVIKTLHKYAPSKPIWLVVNNVVGINDGEAVFAHLRAVSARFLGHPIEYLGAIQQDSHLVDAVREQRPVVEHAPDRPASRSFRVIAKHLDEVRLSSEKDAGMYWPSLADVEG
jgi:flagellar biosynthesis protein FlhG